MYSSHRKVKDAIDTNVILIDMSPLFNTEIDDIHLEIMNLKKKLTSVPTDNVNDQQKGTFLFLYVLFLKSHHITSEDFKHLQINYTRSFSEFLKTPHLN